MNLKENSTSLFEQLLQIYLQNSANFLSLFEFKNSYNFNNCYGFYANENRKNTKMYNLLETIICLNDRDDKLNKFKDMAIKCLKPDQLKSLLHEIWADFTKFQSYPGVYQMFKQRLQQLEEQLKDMPQFTWKMMPYRLYQHPEIEEFIKSEKTSLVYSNQKFKNREDLRKSLDDPLRYGGGDCCSTKVYYRSWGVHSSVHIVKSKDWFYRKYGNIKEIKKEIDLIKKQLTLFTF